MVQTGINVNHVNDPGWTALLEAVVYGDGSARYQEIVRILLASGADPAIRRSATRTAGPHWSTPTPGGRRRSRGSCAAVDLPRDDVRRLAHEWPEWAVTLSWHLAGVAQW